MSETLLTALTEIPDETEGHDNENGNKEPPLNGTSNTIDSAIRSELDYIWSKINNIESDSTSTISPKGLMMWKMKTQP